MSLTVVLVQVIGQMQEKLRLHCAPVQLPIGLEDQHAGLIDLIKMKAFQFKGPNGEDITEVQTFSSPADAAAHHSKHHSSHICTLQAAAVSSAMTKLACTPWEALPRVPNNRTERAPVSRVLTRGEPCRCP